MILAERIKQLRKEKGWSQDELAQHSGVDGRQISRYENGRITPSVDVVIKLAKTLGVSTDYLLLEQTPRNVVTTPEAVELERLKGVDQLNEQDRETLYHVLEALLVKTRIKEFANQI